MLKVKSVVSLLISLLLEAGMPLQNACWDNGVVGRGEDLMSDLLKMRVTEG